MRAASRGTRSMNGLTARAALTFPFELPSACDDNVTERGQNVPSVAVRFADPTALGKPFDIVSDGRPGEAEVVPDTTVRRRAVADRRQHREPMG